MIEYPTSLNLARLNTPLESLNAYFKDIYGYNIWLKRDDLTGIELSGNKIRKLDFLLKDALNKNATHVITCGGLYSNHCRATAFAACKIGLKAVLILRGESPDSLQGNYFLNQICGAKIEFITPQEYQNVDEFMRSYASHHVGNFYIIPEGGSNEIGAWGYVRCFEEILKQSSENNLDIEMIVVATGSGGTHAGLLLGKLLTNSSIEVLSVNVCDSAKYFRNKIHTILQNFCIQNKYGLHWDIDDIKILDGYVGDGYGLIGKREVALIKKFAAKTGIILDPVYGAKAFAGFEESIQQKKMQSKNIVFIHTGGIFGVFPYWDKFLV
jgi:D-cysteine desulfhydrase